MIIHNLHDSRGCSPDIQGWWYLWPQNVLLFKLSNHFASQHKDQIRPTLGRLERKLDYCIMGFKESHSSRNIMED